MFRNHIISRKILVVIEGIVTIFVLVMAFFDIIHSRNVKIVLLSIVIVLSIIYLICKWIIRKEYSHGDNWLDALYGLFMLGVSVSCLISIM
jgi:hypothetical protein